MNGEIYYFIGGIIGVFNGGLDVVSKIVVWVVVNFIIMMVDGVMLYDLMVVNFVG